MQTPLYMPLKDACARYGRARSLMYRLIGDDLIKAKKYGDSLLIVVESADAYFRALPDAKVTSDRPGSKLPKQPADEGAG
jgi:hypothetical protein